MGKRVRENMRLKEEMLKRVQHDRIISGSVLRVILNLFQNLKGGDAETSSA